MLASRDRAAFIRLVEASHRLLADSADLSPANEAINAQLSELVATILAARGAPWANDVLDEPRLAAILPDLRRRLGQAETELERHYAALFNARPRLTDSDLEAFPYFDCYRQLAAAEARALASLAPAARPRRLVMVGCGPLPLSLVALRAHLDLPALLVDRDPTAMAEAEGLVARLGLDGTVETVAAQGAEAPFAPGDLVLIASLVDDKESVARAAPAQSLLLARSVEGLCRVLYTPIDSPILAAGEGALLGRSQPSGREINTTLLYRRAAQARQAA